MQKTAVVIAQKIMIKICIKQNHRRTKMIIYPAYCCKRPVYILFYFCIFQFLLFFLVLALKTLSDLHLTPI